MVLLRFSVPSSESPPMDSLAQGFRFLFGLGMVAAGSALVVPTGLHLFQLTSQHASHRDAAPRAAEPAWAMVPEPGPGLPLEGAPAVEAWPPVAGHRLEYVPPPLPQEPLPPQPPMLGAAGPGLAPGYRPTLQSPPPPLLDAQTAPPLAAGWIARQPEAAPRATLATDQPRIYIVRDGDDLTGIASRFYGHPAAAATIWEANRGLLRDPRLLPIGAALVLPPQSAVAAAMRPSDHASIEPVMQARPVGPPAGEPVARPDSWLSGAAVPNGLVPPST